MPDTKFAARPPINWNLWQRAILEDIRLQFERAASRPPPPRPDGETVAKPRATMEK